MTGRPLMVATLLGASVGVPYAVSHTQQAAKSGPPTPPAVASPHWSTGQPSYAAPHSTSPLAAPPMYGQSAPPAIGSTVPPPLQYMTIPQVFRFDVSREWVYQNWDRKSTGLGDPSSYGVRVPLVTGTGMTDLAGSLTYHFSPQGQVEHISFRGRTADTSAILQYLTQTYRLQRLDAPAGEQLYQVRSGNDVYSEFRSRPEGVLNTQSPHASFGVVIELGRPGLNRPLVPQTPKLELPPAAAAPPAPAAESAAKGAAEAGEAEPALVGKLRPATPAEEAQVMQRRWPN